MSSNFDQIRPRTAEKAALEHLKKIPNTYNGENLVSTLVPSFLIGSSSFLHVTRTTIKTWMSLNFSGIPPLTVELAALEHLKEKNNNKKQTTYKLVSTLVPSFFDWIFFILAGNKDNYIVSNKFEIGPDPTMDCGVSSP